MLDVQLLSSLKSFVDFIVVALANYRNSNDTVLHVVDYAVFTLIYSFITSLARKRLCIVGILVAKQLMNTLNDLLVVLWWQ